VVFENVPALVEDYAQHVDQLTSHHTPSALYFRFLPHIYQLHRLPIQARCFDGGLQSVVPCTPPFRPSGRACTPLPWWWGVNSFSLVVSTTRNRALFIRGGGEKGIFSQNPCFKYDMIEDDEGDLRYAFMQELPSSSLNPSEASSHAAVES
jgi:hypothetical protein